MTELNELQKRIIEIIENFQGIKNTELAISLIAEFKFSIDAEEITKQIEELVMNGEILEIEYILPRLDYRVKSFYLPKGTKLRLSVGEFL